MATPYTAQLQHIVSDAEELHCEYAYDEHEYRAMCAAERYGFPVTVLCEATDGYFDVLVGDVQIDALCGKYIFPVVFPSQQ